MNAVTITNPNQVATFVNRRPGHRIHLVTTVKISTAYAVTLLGHRR
jgi:hypothetical protein